MVVINGKEFESIEQAQEFLNSIREEEKVAENNKKISAIYEKRKALIDEFLNVVLVTTFDEDDGEVYHLICTLSNTESRAIMPLAIAEHLFGDKYEIEGTRCKELYRVAKVPKINQSIKNFLVEECDWRKGEWSSFDNVDLNSVTYSDITFFNGIEGYDGSLKINETKSNTGKVEVKPISNDVADLIFSLLFR